MAQLLLDRIPGAAAAYSLRKLSDTYTGAAVRVRRSSDNTEQDIGFVGVDLDEGALLAFVGAGSGYVTKWYDQSGNTRDAVQATQANQPRLVNGGVVDKQNNKPSVRFNNVYMEVPDFNYSSYTDLSLFVCSSKDSTSTVGIIMAHGDYGVRNTFSWLLTYDPSKFTGIVSQVGTLAAANLIATNTGYTTNLQIVGYQYKGSNSASTEQLFYLNGTSLATTLSGTYFTDTTSLYNSSDNMMIGCEFRNGSYANRLVGYISDIILYNSDQSSNRVLIESNINGYYSIYIPVTASANTLFTSAAAAYSVRQLLPQYTGPSMRVRRTTDSTESDIYFVNNQLDEGALLAFTGGQNLTTYSEDFGNAVWTKQNSTIATNTTTAPDGTLTADTYTETTANGLHNTYQGPITISANTNYTVSCYFKYNSAQYATIWANSASSTNKAVVVVDLINATVTQTRGDGTFTYVSSSIQNVGNGWYRVALTFSTSGTTAYVITGACRTGTPFTATTEDSYVGSTSTNLYIWGVQLSIGNLQAYQQTTSATRDGMGYVTKWYDQSLGSQQNLVQYSEQINNAAWGLGDVTVTADSTTAPDGTTTADTITEVATTPAFGHGVASPTFAFVSGTTYTMSTYAKNPLGGRGFVQLAGYQLIAGPINPYANFDIINGAVTAQGNGTGSITSVGNGWFRCSFTFTCTNSLTERVNVRMITSGTAPAFQSYTGDTSKSLYIWGTQLNTSTFARYYTPTTNATVNALRDASQGTAANQPRIVNAGVVEKVNSKPAMFFDSTNDNLIVTNSTAIDLQTKTITSVSRANVTANFQGLYDKWIGGAPSTGYMLDYSSAGNLGRPRFTSAGATSAGTSIQSAINVSNVQALITAIINGASSSLTVNGTTTTGTLDVASGNSDNLLFIADGVSTLRTDTYLQEFTMWNSDQTNNRTPIQTNINGYYSIY